MGIEIERKFLLKSDRWRQFVTSRRRFVQGYLSTTVERTVRVRLVDDQGWLTIKGKSAGVKRSEYEYLIPAAEALEMLHTLCEQPLIDKWRHLVEVAGKVWEIDEFLGDNAGLIVAEIELSSEDEDFKQPQWLGVEVTHDPRYFNSNLIQHPYCRW